MSRNPYIISLLHFKMEVTQPKKFVRKDAKQTVEVPKPKEEENTYPFQWMLFKPQAHAVTPFQTNTNSRDQNKQRLSK